MQNEIWRGTCIQDAICARCKGPIFKGQNCLIYYTRRYKRGQKLICPNCTMKDPEWSQWEFNPGKKK